MIRIQGKYSHVGARFVELKYNPNIFWENYIIADTADEERIQVYINSDIIERMLKDFTAINSPANNVCGHVCFFDFHVTKITEHSWCTSNCKRDIIATANNACLLTREEYFSYAFTEYGFKPSLGSMIILDDISVLPSKKIIRI